LKSNLFHIDWFRRRKKARYKPSKLVGIMDTRRDSETQGELAEFLAVYDLGVKMLGCGKRGKGLGKGGPKRMRKMLSEQHPWSHEAGDSVFGCKKGARGEDRTANWAVAQNIIPWPAAKNRSRKDGWRSDGTNFSSGQIFRSPAATQTSPRR
jgi:hypothetical protein